MKRFFLMLMMAVAALAFASCEGNDGGENGSETPGGGNGSGNESGFYEFPLAVQEEGFEAGEDGVTINVSSIKDNNIIFNLVPGAAIKSYRVEVYPKAMLYNLLLNEGCVDGTQEECEDKIIQLIKNSSSAGSNVFNSTSDDFSEKEFDWANSEYAGAVIVPDCDYYIMVLGCYDPSGANPASLSIASVTTTSRELIGSPEIAIEAETGYRAFIVKYHPNSDCKFFYHWIWSTEEMSEYMDLFGDRMMRDFCRTAVSAAYDATLEENLFVKRTFDVANNIIRENTAVAVAVDANGTPAADIIRYDFSLLEIPDGDFTPVARIKAGDRIGATLAYFDVEMEKTAMSCFYRLYTAENADLVRSLSGAEKDQEALSIANEGWGVANDNFSFNSDLGTLTGDSFKTSNEVQVELQPDTEYVVLYVAKNNFGELSELCFSEPFKTRKLVRDNPDACVADVKLELTDVSRWGFTYNFTYDYETTACYRFQIVYPYIEDDPATDADDDFIRPPHYINDADDREKWMTFFYDTYQDGPAGLVPIVNMWEAEPSNYDGFSMYGYESGITYVVAYCAEDINGVVGPVKFVQATTTAPNPGPKPTISVEDIEFVEKDGQINVRFKANEDTKMIKYFGVASSDASLFSACALNDLVNTSRRDYAAYLALWENQLIQLGLSSTAESVMFSTPAEKNSNSPVLVAAVAIGEDDGEDVYSPVAAKIFHKGEFKDLADFRTPPTE